MTHKLSKHFHASPLPDEQQFIQCNYLGLLLSGALLTWVYPHFNVDQTLIAPFFNEKSQSFPLNQHYFYNQIMHVYLKYMLIVFALLTLFLGLFGQHIKYIKKSIVQHQKALLWSFVCMLLACMEIAYFKSISAHGCPNDLAMYGGNLPLLTLFESPPPYIKAGHCFPGGHASAGFALMSFYFAFRKSAPTFAKNSLCLSIVLGLAMGWTQMVRGEHFLSHNLWTGWFVWMTLFSLDYFHTIFSNRKYWN